MVGKFDHFGHPNMKPERPLDVLNRGEARFVIDSKGDTRDLLTTVEQFIRGIITDVENAVVSKETPQSMAALFLVSKTTPQELEALATAINTLSPKDRKNLPAFRDIDWSKAVNEAKKIAKEKRRAEYTNLGEEVLRQRKGGA